MDEACEFITDLSGKNLEELIEFCMSSKGNEEITILSRALLSVLREIEDYIACFDEKIEKGFGVTTSSEMKRIEEEVFKNFFDYINKEELSEIKNRWKAVFIFIRGWDKFKKENEQEILGKSKLEDKTKTLSS